MNQLHMSNFYRETQPEMSHWLPFFISNPCLNPKTLSLPMPMPMPMSMPIYKEREEERYTVGTPDLGGPT